MALAPLPLDIVAVDPGLTGAFARLRRMPDGSIFLLAMADMPTAEAKQGKTIKRHIQAALLSDCLLARYLPVDFAPPAAVVVEQVSAMPGQGVVSMFRFGYAAGLVEGAAGALGLPVTFMLPRTWQAVAGVRSSPDAGRLRACQLFPKQAHMFERKKDHNRADAALIGYAYLRSQPA